LVKVGPTIRLAGTVPEFHFSVIFKMNSSLMMHCYEIIPSCKAWLCFNPWLGGRHFSTVGSGVTDLGAGMFAAPPDKFNAKKWRFHNMQNMKVRLQVLEIRWSW